MLGQVGCTDIVEMHKLGWQISASLKQSRFTSSCLQLPLGFDWLTERLDDLCPFSRSRIFSKGFYFWCRNRDRQGEHGLASLMCLYLTTWLKYALYNTACATTVDIFRQILPAVQTLGWMRTAEAVLDTNQDMAPFVHFEYSWHQQMPSQSKDRRYARLNSAALISIFCLPIDLVIHLVVQ